MKDITFKNIPKDTVYKDVVIIGNGPSGITLSYMLNGNWPYWNLDKIQNHPDELLCARLNYLDSNKSLIEHDLIALSDGLEGRSTNPISLLYDSLEHPGADIGMELPSMLEYKSHPNAKIDHIVLGKGPPGGSWHRMDPNLRTLSLATWMSLPAFNYNDWEIFKQQQRKQQKFCEKSFIPTTTNLFDLKIHNNHNLRRQAIKNSIQITNCKKCCTKLQMIQKQNQKQENLYNNCDLKNNELIIENNNNNSNEAEIGALCCKCFKELNNLKTQTESVTTTNDIIVDKKNKFNEINSDDDDNSSSSNSNSGNKELLENITNSPPRRNLSLKRQISKEVQTRALVSRVAKYYENYVHLMGLEKFFMNDAIVTMIAPIQENCAQGKFQSARWIVCGINRTTGRPFYFACANVVLANGASDLPNRLGLRGENLYTSWVKHELPQLETALESLSENERSCLKPVLIVGAGLSAADAVTICRSSDIPVIHVFRSRTAGLDKMLPENVYPEYHEVHRMMKDSKNKYDYYTPVPEHTICDLNTNSNGIHEVTVENMNTGEKQIFEISFCAILIGSKPDLRFTTAISNKTTSSTLPLQKCLSITSLLVNNEKLLDNNTTMTNTTTIIGRKIAWLKNLCAKCKHLNLLCDRNRTTTTTTTTTTIHSTFGQQTKISTNQILNRTSSMMDNNCTDFKEIDNNSDSLLTDENGLGLGVDPTKPIDCKTNQIAVNKYTYEILNGYKGLYAMGPLVGDNFVRFIPGGALAITAALHKEND